MEKFIQSLYKKLFSKALARPTWLDSFSINGLIQNAYGKSARKKNLRRGSSLASLGLHLPQIELLECRITPATLPSASLLSHDHNLVIITQDLVDRVPQQELANACVVTLDPAKDAINQITSELASRSGLETLRIISHGEAGVLHFGNQVVDQGVLAARADEIATWANSLASDADLLLYGCDVAQSEVGQNFVITLAQLTGADVAASIDATGAGGNTALEFAAGGMVDAGLRASTQDWEAADLQLPSFGDFTYSIDGLNRLTIMGYNGAGGAVTIPTIIDSLPVTSIHGNAFRDKTSITSVTIPIFLTTIGGAPFKGCSGLTAISVDAANLNFSSADGILYNKVKTTLIQCPGGKTGSVTIPAGVTTIGTSAFSGCISLTAITIPNSVTSIDYWAFRDCTGLTSITIPNSVTTIDYGAFSGCTGLTSVTIPNSVTAISADAFFGCTGLTAVTIPNSVTAIGTNAFYSCTGLTAVTIPNSVTSIEQGAFSDCTGLTAVTIPNSVTTIGTSAFSGCTGLTTVTIPDSLTALSDWAFSSCSRLTAVTIPDSVTAISDSAFRYCYGLTAIYFLGNAPALGATVFDAVPGTVYYLQGKAGWTNPFGGLPTVAVNYNSNGFNWTIKNGAITITGYTGVGEAVAIPATIFSLPVTIIGDNAFQNKTAITSITLPNSVTAIGDYAFSGCTGLATVTLPNSVTAIGSGAFYNCTGLTTVTIPDSLTALSDSAFRNCASLTALYFLGNAPSLGSGVFNNVPGTVYYLSGTSGWSNPFGGRPSQVFTLGPINILLSSATLPENSPIGNTVATLTSASVVAGDGFTYTLVAGPGSGDNAAFTIDGASLKLALVPDFETKSSFSVRIRSADASNIAFEKQFTILVTDVNEAPVITSGSTGTVAENAVTSTAIYTATATDVDAGATVTFSIKPSVGDASLVAIDAVTGAVTLNASANFEAKPSYTFTMVATDNNGLTAEKSVTVSVTNVNEAPIITSGSSGTVAENAATTTAIYSATASDVDAGATRTFSIKPGVDDASLVAIDASTGVVTLVASANFEVKPSYTFAVVATDQGDLTTEKSVTVSVTNVNEAPVITSGSSGTVAENAATSTAIYTATSTDVDAGATVTFSIKTGVGDASLVAIDAVTGAVTLNASANFEAKPSYTFTMVATDNNGLTAEKSVTVSVTNVNEAPVITSGSTGTVAENSATATVIYTATATDVDAGATIAFSIKPGVGDASLVSIDGSTGVVTLVASANFEAKPSYTFAVVATDNGGLTAEKPVAVTITDVNEAPVTTTNKLGTVAENSATSTVIYTATATDVDAGATIAFSIKPGVGDAGLVAIDAATGAMTLITSANFEVKSSYTFTVVATDNGTPGLMAERSIIVLVSDVNEAPVITSVSTGTVAENASTATVIYTATATDVDAGATIAFSIKPGVGDAGLVAIDGSTGLVTLITSANFEVKTSYTFTVVATDNGGLTAEKSVTVSVTDVNEAPVITSGSTGTVAENAATATGIYTATSTDVDAGATRTYSIKPGVDDASLFAIDASTGVVTLVASANFEVKTSYTFTVVATDNGGLTAEKSVTVTITDVNEAPVITSGSSGTVAENAATSTAIYTATSTDVDAGATVTFSIKPGVDDASLVAIDASTGVVTLVASANFEVKSSYTFTVVATDNGGLTAEKSVTVTITDVNEAPVITSGSTGTVAENAANATAIYTATASDVDAGASRTFSIKPGVDDASLVAIDASTGVVTLVASANFEAKPSYTFTVVATDNGGLTAEKSVTVTITDVNEAPVITSGSTGTVAENAANATAIYTATASDVDAGSTRTFSIKPGVDDASLVAIDASTGVVTLVASANFEAKSSYTFTVVATDNGGLTAEKSVTVTITDVNEAPVITSGSTGTVAENAATATVIYTATASDVDAGASRTFSIKPGVDDASLVSIDASTGVVTLVASANFEAKPSYTFTVIATDNGGLTAEKSVTVSVTDVNEAPVITSGSTGTVAENAATATGIYTATSTDVDAGATRTYSIKPGVDDASLFAIDASTGVVTLVASANFEAKASYTFTVVATDNGGLTAEKSVTVTITDVNEAPVITSGSTGSVAENAATATVTYTATSTDVDAGATRTFSIKPGVDDANLVSIDASTGVVTLVASANFEAKPSYTFTVIATDNGGLTAEKSVTVTITDVNEAPIANTQSITPTEDTLFHGTLPGSDIENSTLTYSVVSQGTKGTVVITNTETGAFTYTPTTNATGADSFTFKVNDGSLNSVAAVVTVNINAVNDAPINNAIPEISGPTRIAGVLTASNGTWNDAADGNPGFDFSYQWFRLKDEPGARAELISGANGSEYTIQTPDLGKYLRVRVTAADRGNPGSLSVSAVSNPIRIPGVKPLATGSGALVTGTKQGDSPTPSTPMNPFPGFTGEVHISSLEVTGGKGEIQDTELVIGAGQGGGPHVKVMSMKTGKENGSFMAYDAAFRGGVFISVGDVTGDGLADIVTSTGPGGGPHVKVFDRATMTEVVSFFAYAAEFRSGVTVAVVDVDLDGVGEIVTGAGQGGGPHVKVFKISAGAIVVQTEFFAFDPELRNGIHVSGGDIDGDGRVELVVGLGEGGGPLVGVYDANSTRQIDLFFAYSQDFTGGTRVSVSDGDGDGIADLITGAGPGGASHVKVFKNIRAGRTLVREFIAQPGSNGAVLSI